MPKKLFKRISLVLGIPGGVLTLSGISLMLFEIIRAVIEYDSEIAACLFIFIGVSAFGC